MFFAAELFARYSNSTHWFLLFILAASSTLSAQECPKLIWADEFSGASLDTTKWEPMLGDGSAYGIPDNWGNAELQYYQAANATVSNGTLHITAREQQMQGKRYTSARLRTLNKGDFRFGRFEARIKTPETQGLWPAFWMLPTENVYGGWPRSGEIDIMEVIGSRPQASHGTIHYAAKAGHHQHSGTEFMLPTGKFSDDFHVFAVEREPDVIRWFIDDILFLTLTPAHIAPAPWPFNEDFHFLLNVAVGGRWPGYPDSTTVFPQVLEVDYVRVYDGNKPHLAGKHVVLSSAKNIEYAIVNSHHDSSFKWSVPADATIVSGQGTASIKVNWGHYGGEIVCEINSNCGNTRQTRPVRIMAP